MPSGEHDHVNAERLLLHLARFGSTMSRAMADATGQPEFVTNAPLLVLCMLDLDGPERPGVIGQLVGLTSGGTTKLLDRMESAALIERSYGVIEDDHRGVRVTLTAEGRRLLRTATASLTEHLSETTDMVEEVVALLESIGTPDA